MEEQEKKTRKSTSAKNSTSKGTATKKTTKKASTTATEKKSKVVKATVTPQTTKRSTAKEEKEPKSTEEKIVTKVEKKPRKVAENKNLAEDKAKVGKLPKVEEEKNISSAKKTTNSKAKNTDVKDKVEKAKDLKATVNTKSSTDHQKTEKVIENKKTTKKPQIKSEQPKEQEPTEKTKKYIEISIGGIIALLFIGLLIFLNITLGKWAYNIVKEKDTAQNNVVDTNAEVEEEIGTVLNHQNEIVNKLIEKITLPVNTTASIYQLGTFDENTIPDDLKLRIGWANLEETSKYHAKQATGETTIVVDKSAMEESIKEIFGAQAKYEDAPFDNTNVKVFSECAETQGLIDYDGETYTAMGNEMAQNGKVAFVYQEIQKVVQYEKEIIILTKTAFVKQEDDKYTVYQNYNEDFENKLIEITPEELFENSTFDKSTGEGAIAVTNNQVLDDIRNELNTYKYTFSKDSTTGEYYLKEFEKENNNA